MFMFFKEICQKKKSIVSDIVSTLQFQMIHCGGNAVFQLSNEYCCEIQYNAIQYHMHMLFTTLQYHHVPIWTKQCSLWDWKLTESSHHNVQLASVPELLMVLHNLLRQKELSWKCRCPKFPFLSTLRSVKFFEPVYPQFTVYFWDWSFCFCTGLYFCDFVHFVYERSQMINGVLSLI